MSKIYIARNCEVTEHELIKTTEKSFIIEHRGGVNGRYVQAKKKRAQYINTPRHLNYINTIFATKNKYIAMELASKQLKELVDYYREKIGCRKVAFDKSFDLFSNKEQ